MDRDVVLGDPPETVAAETADERLPGAADRVEGMDVGLSRPGKVSHPRGTATAGWVVVVAAGFLLVGLAQAQEWMKAAWTPAVQALSRIFGQSDYADRLLDDAERVSSIFLNAVTMAAVVLGGFVGYFKFVKGRRDTPVNAELGPSFTCEFPTFFARVSTIT